MKKLFQIVNAIGSALAKADINQQDLGDYLLDKVEEFVARTDNKIDDAVVLPVVKGLRILWDIPDNDEPENK